MKLSEALLKAGDSMLEDRDLRDLLREASALAKRVEDSATGECVEVGNIPNIEEMDFIGAMIRSTPIELSRGEPIIYRRVAIVPIEEDGE